MIAYAKIATSEAEKREKIRLRCWVPVNAMYGIGEAILDAMKQSVYILPDCWAPPRGKLSRIQVSHRPTLVTWSFQSLLQLSLGFGRVLVARCGGERKGEYIAPK